MMQIFLSQSDTPLRGSGCMSNEALDGRVIDAWACSLNMVQEDVTEGFVANALVRGHFTQDRWRLVPGSLLRL